MSLRSIVAWPAWPFVVAADLTLWSAAVASGYTLSRWSVVLMLIVAAAGWLMLGLRMLEDRRMRGCAP